MVNYSEFRSDLTQNLNAVNEDKEILIVSRAKGKHVVIMDLGEYNSTRQTLYLMSTKANRKRLEEALAEMNKETIQNKSIG